MTVELLGPVIGPHDPNYARERSLWELYAFTAQHDYVTAVFTFDTEPVTLRPAALPCLPISLT